MLKWQQCKYVAVGGHKVHIQLRLFKWYFYTHFSFSTENVEANFLKEAKTFAKI